MKNTTKAPESASPQTQISIIAEYGSAIYEVIQPTSYIAMTHYYVSRWAAEVGGTGTLLILNLRALGYYNPTTKEARGEITISLPELAKRCGVSVNTIKREFASNQALQRFIQREPKYRRDRTGEVYRTENIYHVRMDDPLHPDDEAKAQEIADALQKGAHDGMGQSGRGRKRTKATYDTTQGQGMAQTDTAPIKNGADACQSAPLSGQNNTGGVQNGLALKNHSVLPPITKNTINTQEVAASPPCDSFSLSKEGEGIAAEPPVDKQGVHDRMNWYDVCRLVMADGGDRANTLEALRQKYRENEDGSKRFFWVRLVDKTAAALDSEFRRDAKLW